MIPLNVISFAKPVNWARRQFLADASHELRTPLTSIQGFAELYRRGGAPPGPALNEAMGRIEAEVGRMRLLVNDLLLLASVPVILVALSWFLLKTDAGIAVRGVADNRERAQLLGIPVDRLGTIVWAIAGAVASTATAM